MRALLVDGIEVASASEVQVVRADVEHLKSRFIRLDDSDVKILSSQHDIKSRLHENNSNTAQCLVELARVRLALGRIEAAVLELLAQKA